MKKFLAFLIFCFGATNLSFAQAQSVVSVKNSVGASGTRTPVFVILSSDVPTATPTAVNTPGAGTNTFTPTNTPTNTATPTAVNVNVLTEPNSMTTPIKGIQNALVAATPTIRVVSFTGDATVTPTATPILADIIIRSFTSAQSTTPTPIITAVASTFPHFQLFFNNTGTAGDFVTVYVNGTTKTVYLAPAGGVVTKSFWATSANQAVSIGSGNAAGSTIVVWGIADLQTYQLPTNLPHQ